MPGANRPWLLLFAVLALGCPGDDDDAFDDEAGDDDTTESPADAVEGQVEAENSAGRRGSFYLPEGYNLHPLPLLVAFHGTGGSGADMLGAFRSLTDEQSFLIVAPDSRVSPSGDFTWEVGTEPGEITEDVGHTVACVEEVLAYPGVQLDGARVLATGFSGGGSSAPYVATLEPLFTHFAVLHGGVFVGGLGDHVIPGWFSTGEDDELRPPQQVAQAAQAMEDAGFPDIEFHVYPGAHVLTPQEKAEMIAWWLP